MGKTYRRENRGEGKKPRNSPRKDTRVSVKNELKKYR